MSGAQHTPAAFDSAYPGSMVPRRDGDYIRRDDPASLAAALLEQIATLKRRVEDLEGLSELQKAAPAMFAALNLALQEMRAMRAAAGPGLMTDHAIGVAESAIARAER